MPNLPSPKRKNFGPFELLRPLSSGGMGELFVARLRGPYNFEKQLILKLIKQPLRGNAQILQRFAREARIAAQCSHRNLVQIYDFGCIDETYFMTMEYVDGVNLLNLTNALAREGLKLPPALSAFVIAEIAQALFSMHTLRDSKGGLLTLLHRDVSPENILISRTGEVKLADFGLVKYSGAEAITQIGKVHGKAYYMAPERVIGGDALPASDQFSLGLVLHELLIGRRYFADGTAVADVQRVLVTENLKPPSHFIKTIPAVLDRLVERTLVHEAHERLPSMRDFEMVLRRYLQRQATPHTTPHEQLSLLIEAVLAEKKLTAIGFAANIASGEPLVIDPTAKAERTEMISAVHRAAEAPTIRQGELPKFGNEPAELTLGTWLKRLRRSLAA